MIYEPEEGGEVIFLTREDGEMNGWNALVLGIVENRGYVDRVYCMTFIHVSFFLSRFFQHILEFFIQLI